MTYLLIHEDGTFERVRSHGSLPLDGLQALVGGHIEHVRMAGNGLGCMVNEEGVIRGLPRNARYPNLFGPIVFGRMVPGLDGMDFSGLTVHQLAVLEGGGSFGAEVECTIYMDRSRTLTDDDYKLTIVDPNANPLLGPRRRG